MSKPLSIGAHSFVFQGWKPDGFVVESSGCSPCIHLGLPYVEFNIITDEGLVSVRCDPCTSWQAMAGYRAMVLRDLSLEVAKQRRESSEKLMDGPPNANLDYVILKRERDEILSEVADVARRIGPASRQEWICEKLDEILSRHQKWREVEFPAQA